MPRSFTTGYVRLDERASVEKTSAGGEQLARERFGAVLSALPPVDFGIAYGSGVLAQAGAPPATLVDFIVAAPDLEAFHAANLRENPDHYPLFARVLGAPAVAALNDRWGAGLWYVTMVRVAGLEVKYGVLSTQALLDDLSGWRTLYAAGRLQKPVLVLQETADVAAARADNARAALSYALLLLPREFSEFALWEKVTGISYSGDPRMSVPGGENPRKIQNIVRGDGVLGGFRGLYGPHVARTGLRFANSTADRELNGTGTGPEVGAGAEVAGFLWRGDGEQMFQQPEGPEHDARLVTDLPRPLRVRVARRLGTPEAEADVDDARAWLAATQRPEFRKVIEDGEFQQRQTAAADTQRSRTSSAARRRPSRSRASSRPASQSRSGTRSPRSKSTSPGATSEPAPRLLVGL